MAKKFDFKGTGELYSLLPGDVVAQIADPHQLQPSSSQVIVDLISTASSKKGQKGGNDTFETRVKNRLVQLDNPESKKKNKPSASPAQKLRGRMNAKQIRETKAFELPKQQKKYVLFESLHQLWTSYTSQLLSNDRNTQSIFMKISKADWHGAILTVTRCRCPSYVGQSGIVVKETENMFYLITKKDQLKGIPKQNTVFTMTVAGHALTVFGNQLICRSADRSSKKFKSKPSVDL